MAILALLDDEIPQKTPRWEVQESEYGETGRVIASERLRLVQGIIWLDDGGGDGGVGSSHAACMELGRGLWGGGVCLSRL